MNVLSIDVGIKNLALCLFNIESKEDYKILDWNVVNGLFANLIFHFSDLSL